MWLCNENSWNTTSSTKMFLLCNICCLYFELLKKMMRDVAVTDNHHTQTTVMKSKTIDSLEKMQHSECKG